MMMGRANKHFEKTMFKLSLAQQEKNHHAR